MYIWLIVVDMVALMGLLLLSNDTGYPFFVFCLCPCVLFIYFSGAYFIIAYELPSNLASKYKFNYCYSFLLHLV
jgi:hypothetical protein